MEITVPFIYKNARLQQAKWYQGTDLISGPTFHFGQHAQLLWDLDSLSVEWGCHLTIAQILIYYKLCLIEATLELSQLL